EKTLPPVALEALMEVSLNYNENLEWSEEMVKEALEATPIGIRMIDLFKKLVEGKKKEIAGLREGAQFGCNGFIKERKQNTEQNTIVALCLYR
ncbi:hypothetical protein V3C99_001213, partial [Haemonchus contortus]